MSYGQKPSAWARPQGAQQQQPLNSSLFTNQLGLAATGQPFGSIPGMPLNSGLAGLVNQAAFTNTMNNMSTMNSMLAQARTQMIPQQQIQQHQPAQRQQQQQQPTTSPTRSQRTFIGVVTKLMETYGFVDEDVFFQTNVIRGSMPHVGDRVMVEANFNPSMPFKWNAYRIQLIQDAPPQPQQPVARQMPQQQPQQQQNGASGSRWGDRMARDEPRRQQPTLAHRSPAPVKRAASRGRSPPARRSPPPRKRESPRREAKRDRDTGITERDRGDSSVRSVRGRSEAKRDAESPPRRRQRIIPRYHCNLPKQTLPNDDMKCADLRRRYANLYIPSDFIRINFDWMKSIQLEQPMKCSPHPILFHILPKDIDMPLAEGESPPVNPSDADYRYTVKVLLISHPGLSALRQKLSGIMPDGSIDETVETQPVTKNIQLLVGHRGKGEYMCIGGAWSPSMDGTNPLDPQTLVNTAVRTTRALTGLDLSNCSRWYKMVHLSYFRVERQRVDSVVLMLPDTGAVPDFKVTAESFPAAEKVLQDQLAAKLAAIDAEDFCPPNQTKAAASTEDQPKTDGSVTTSGSGIVEGHGVTVGEAQMAGNPAMESSAPAKTGGGGAADPEATDATQSDQQTDEEKETQTSKKDAIKTHWTELEPNIRAMKVAELREQLELRSLDSKGVKNVLMQRLMDAIEKEKMADPQNVGNGAPAQQQPDAQAATATASSALTEDPTAAAVGEESEKAKQSIILNIKEEIIELMETDEASEEKKESAEEKEAREKAEKERQELEKAKEKFEKEKKERKAALERHYAQIPKEPGIFVYPSKTAKSGKFDCKLLSLHSLLDYRQDDNKEASFEVFLFAEALKEALDRSNAFIVYHTISTALDREAEKKRRNEALAEACKDEEVLILDEEAGEGGPEKKVENKEKEEKVTGAEKLSKSPTNAAANIDLRTNFKALVHDFDTFMAFVHFDSNICGYLIDRDLEDIIHSIGLDLSRGEVQRLVKKLASKDRINYRDLTDKWVDKDGEVKYISVPTYEDATKSFEQHAKGHADHLAAAAESAKSAEDLFGEMQQLREDPNPIVFFKGTMVNVKHCLEQQNLLEKERQSVQDKNEQLELNLKSTKEQRDQLDKKKRRLEDDLDRYKKKLHETERSLKKEQEENATAKKSLMDCKRYGERIATIVETVYPTPKPKEPEKEKSSASVATAVAPAREKDNKEDNAIVLTDQADGGVVEQQPQPSKDGQQATINGQQQSKRQEEAATKEQEQKTVAAAAATESASDAATEEQQAIGSN